MSFLESILRKKNIATIKATSRHTQLKKTLGVFELFAIGIGAVVGSGIFAFTGFAAQVAGPAIVLSFALAGITCIFVALAYTEVAAALPVSGGSYTYAYVSLGEFVAWLVGWSAIVQFGGVAIAVAMGWSSYLVGILEQFNIHLPLMLIKGPFEGGIINVPAVLISAFMSILLIRGIGASSIVNVFLVIVKLLAIFIFLGISIPKINPVNWENFAPFGMQGIAMAAGILFLSYTGFDAIANAAEETKKPEKNIVIALILSVVFSAILYILVSGTVTGIAHFTLLNNSEPLAYALKLNGSKIGGSIVAVGAITGMTSVIMLQIYALTRVLMSMSRDGLLPKVFSKIHPKYSTPHVNTIIIGGSVGILSGIFPMLLIGNLTSISTLFVLSIVIISTIILRYTKPNLHRPFRCPILMIIGTLALLFCGYLMYNLFQVVGLVFIAWLGVGILIYFVYSRKRATKIYCTNH